MAMVKNGQAKLTDPTYVEAAQAVANLGKQGYFGKGVATLDYTAGGGSVLAGQSRHVLHGELGGGDFTTLPVNKIGVNNVGFFPFPNVSWRGRETRPRHP